MDELLRTRLDARDLFRELAGLPPERRKAFYLKEDVSTGVRAEVESLLSFDGTSGVSMTSVVRSAAEHFLISGAPVSDDGRCGAYRLLRLLGNGGMGAVYLAERADGELDQCVAIKFLRADADVPTFRERFLRERQILASLNHPGIARLLDAGHSEGHPYLVMEYVEGTRIDQYAAALDLRSVLELMVKVAEAVSYAHRNLIIHRDLKPSNILVDASGQPKLLDFGIARILDTAEQTQTLDRVMTPEYASPEQVRGDAQATTTDVYSFAAVLYRLLTGRSSRTIQCDPAELPKDIASILSKAMREEPEERYASMDLLIEDIRAYLDHRPVRARRGNALYVARKFFRRRWVPISATALAVVGLAGGLLVANRERAIAQRRFQQVRQLSNQFFALDAEIRVLPGSTKARHRIVSASLQYLERLGSEARLEGWGFRSDDDTQLALEIGSAYLQVARVQGIPTTLNLGQFAESRKSLERADSFVESVLAVHGFSGHRKALVKSAEIATDSAILAQTENRREETKRYIRKAAERLETLLTTQAPTPEEASAAARLYVNLALNNSNLHDLDQAIVYARKAVDISRNLARDQHQLSRALSVYAVTARFAGDLDGALEAIREARAMAVQRADPNDADKTLILAGAIWREGLILGEFDNISLQRPKEALPVLQEAFDVAENLARKDPNDYSSRSYVSMAGRELGDVLREHHPERALAVYDQALRRTAEIKNNLKARRDEVWLLTGSSYVLRRLGRPAEARQRIETALATLRKLNDYPAASIEPGQEADATLRALGDHYAETGQLAAALNTYDELRRKVQEFNPQPRTDLRHANSLSRIYRELSTLHRRAGHMNEANSLDNLRTDLWRYWDHKLPKNPYVQHQLLASR